MISDGRNTWHKYLEAHMGQVGLVVPALHDHLEYLENLDDLMGHEAHVSL